MKKILTAVCLLATLVSFTQDKIKNADIKNLKALMTGTFSSEAQAKKDTNFFNITLHMEEVAAMDDAFWLYVEQAVTTALDKPYRQRLYRVYRIDDTTVGSVIYEFKEPKQFIGAWKNAEGKKTLAGFVEMTKTDDGRPNLLLRQGCTMFLKKSGNKFWGSTKGNNCTSALRGAAYATSEAVITKEGLVTLDRGYDAAGKQVWGSEHGGYQFMRQ